MDKPKKGEHWTVEYGVKPNRIIVKVLEEPKLDEVVKNWRCRSIKADSLGEEILVSGDCFKERW